MVSLIAKTPLHGFAPETHGRCTLSEIRPGPIASVAPWPGREALLSQVMLAAHGVVFPGSGKINASDTCRAAFSGRAQCFLIGTAPGPALADHAAVTDQSDGWAVLELEGADAEAVLARLVPVDLRLASFPDGTAARSQVQHVMALILRNAPQTFQIFVMRSFGQTAVHEITEAMRAVAARAAL